MLKIVIFNLLFVIAEIVIYAGDFLQPEGKLTAGLMSIILFWAVNYHFLKHADRKKFPVNLKTIQDYENALKFWQNKANPFCQEIKTALHQLEIFSQKRFALQTLTQKDTMFESVSQDVQSYLCLNVKKILNRMLILDLSEQGRLQMHKVYLCRILEENQNLLNQYDNLMIEISQLGEYDNQMPCLELITEALQELRNKEELL